MSRPELRWQPRPDDWHGAWLRSGASAWWALSGARSAEDELVDVLVDAPLPLTIALGLALEPGAHGLPWLWAVAG